MESLLNKAELIIEKSHEALVKGGLGSLFQQPLFCKLAEIYAEEASKPMRLTNVSLTHKLLDKLVKRDKLNCLVVNLYRGNEGYSLSIKMGSGIETETTRLQYEDDILLSYIDSEELPPMLLDMLDEANVEIFYSGCIIAEVRDFRRVIDSSYDSKYVLLKPTNQSIVADVATLSRDKNWSMKEKLQLEAEIVKHSVPSLNLSPSLLVGLINNKLHQQKYKFSGVPLRRAAKRFSQVTQNRQKVFEECKPPPCLRLHGFLIGRKGRKPLTKTAPKPIIPTACEEIESNVLDSFDLLKQQQEMDSFYQKVTDDVKRVANPLERIQDTTDNTLVFVEEYTLETERGQGRIYLTKLTISQRQTDEIYFGELYVDRDYQDGKQSGSTCRFQLGTLHQVRRYIQQFKEILTEEGRKSVKIVHKIAGQPAKIIMTPGSRDRKELEQIKQHQQQLQHELEKLKQQQDQQLQQQTKQQQPQPQVQQIPQNLLTTFNLTSQQTTTLPLNSSAIAGAVSIAHQTPQNVIIVSNADGALKKSANGVANAVTSAVTTTLTNLIPAQSIHQPTAVGQQMVVGRGLNLASLLSGRSVVASSSQTVGTVTTIPAVSCATVHQVGTKVAVNVHPGHTGTKISLPMLAAQLNRPAPAYSQAVTTVKTQNLNQITVLGDSSIKVEAKSSDNIQNRSSSNSNLQALLAGTPSAENPNPHSKGAALLERLSAQSIGLNSMKLTKHLNEDGHHKVESTANAGHVSSSIQTISNTAVSTVPANINLANITNLPGINVGIPSLTTNLQTLQNVQVSIPGLSTPISFTINNVPTTSSAVIVTSPLLSNIMTKSTGTSIVSSPATVMIASQSGLQQGQVVQLPLGQLSGSHLAAQLTKPGNQTGPSPSGIPLLQVQGVGGSLFTSLRAGSTTPITSAATQQTVQVSIAPTLNVSTSSELPLGQLSQTSTPVGSSIVTLTSKQPVQLAMSKQPAVLTWQLQQKLIAAKRQQHQQLQQQPPK